MRLQPQSRALTRDGSDSSRCVRSGGRQKGMSAGRRDRDRSRAAGRGAYLRAGRGGAGGARLPAVAGAGPISAGRVQRDSPVFAFQ